MTHHHHPLCPHCGYDLRLDTPVLIDDFSMMSSVAVLRWEGEAVKLTGSERILVYTLMKAYPAPVRLSVILDRMDSDATGNVIDVYLCRIRKKLRAIGAPNPIASVRNRGRERMFAWVTGDEYAAASKTA